MLKYALLIGLVLPNDAFAADYIIQEDGSGKNCPLEQWGNRYCQEVPVEKVTTDCNFGAECHHMQSGQHYTQQTPIITDY
jgi:hypothetical protein